MGAYSDQECGKTGVKSGHTFLTGIYECIYLKVGDEIMAGAKAQLVKWGNSQAVRIPKTILEQCNLREGEELEIRVEDGHIWLEPLSQKPTLKSLVEKITPENRHGEQDWGKRVGDEVW